MTLMMMFVANNISYSNSFGIIVVELVLFSASSLCPVRCLSHNICLLFHHFKIIFNSLCVIRLIPATRMASCRFRRLISRLVNEIEFDGNGKANDTIRTVILHFFMFKFFLICFHHLICPFVLSFSDSVPYRDQAWHRTSIDVCHILNQINWEALRDTQLQWAV